MGNCVCWGEKGFEISSGIRKFFGVLAFAAVLISALIFTGAWNYLKDYFTGNNQLFTNIMFLVIVGVAIAVVVGFGGKGEEKK